jgi:single-stranded DNA-binding protein
VKRYKTEVVADNVILLSSPAGSEGGSSYGNSASISNNAPSMDDSAPQESRVKRSNPKVEEEIAIEDIPF